MTDARSRYIPAAVMREVWARDGGQCAFVGPEGRCRARGFLEYHHVKPFGDGGERAASNIQLRCRAHNVYEAERWFGGASYCVANLEGETTGQFAPGERQVYAVEIKSNR